MTRHFGLISFSLMWLGLLFLITRWKGNASLSFSLHATKNRYSYLFYFALFLVTLPLFYIFAIDWYVPTLGLGWSATLAITTGVVFQMTAAIVPDTTGWKRTIHRITAYGMATILSIIGVIVVLNADLSTLQRAMATVALVTMVTLYTLVFMESKHYEQFLIYQAAYVACFHILILTTTYLP